MADEQLEFPVAAGDDSVEEGLSSQGEAAVPEPPTRPETSEPQAPAGSEASPPSWRQQASEHGVDLSSFESDEDAFRYLAEQQRQAQEQQALAQYGQEFVRHAADGSWQQYQEWKAQQQQAQPPAHDPLAWEAPEFNQNWYRQVKYDEAGNLVPDASQGGTVDTVAKIQRYLQYVQDQNQRMWQQGPANYLKPAIEKIAQEQARQIIQGELTKYGEQIDARHFITNNKNWLYKQTNDGQIAYENNQPVLSEEGRVFFNALQRVDGKKNWSQADKQEYALEALYNHRQMQSLKSSQAAAKSPEQRKEEQLAKAAGFVPQEGGSLTQGAGGSNVEEPQNRNMTFREMLAAEFKAAGIEPSDDLVTA